MCQQLEKEEHTTWLVPLAVSNWRDNIACVCVGGQWTSDGRDLSVFLDFLSEFNWMCTCVFVEFDGILQTGLASEWEEKLYIKSEPAVGKVAQAQHIAAGQTDTTKLW